jgi:hypothetical protein
LKKWTILENKNKGSEDKDYNSYNSYSYRRKKNKSCRIKECG